MQYAVRESARLSAQKWRTPRRGSSAFPPCAPSAVPMPPWGSRGTAGFYIPCTSSRPRRRARRYPPRARAASARRSASAREGRGAACAGAVSGLFSGRLPGLRPALRRRGIPPGFGGEFDLRRERRERGARQPPVQRQHTVLRRHHAEIALFSAAVYAQAHERAGILALGVKPRRQPLARNGQRPLLLPVYQNRIRLTHFITPSIFYAPSVPRRVCSRRSK